MRRSVLAILLTLASTAVFAARGQTTLIAGMGSYDGDGNTLPSATFNAPKGVAAYGTNAYIADTLNNVIRKVDMSTGVISTLAGTGTAGSANGALAASTFNQPAGLCIDPSGNTIYVADTTSHKIRGINIAAGLVYTVAGSGLIGGTDGVPASASFNQPYSVVMSADGTYLYVADYNSSRIRRIVAATGYTSTIAGDGTAGYLEGTGTAAKFNKPSGLEINSAGTVLYVADSANNCVRQIALGTNDTSLVAGNTSNASYQEGIGGAAYFKTPCGLSLDSAAGRLYVADAGNFRIRSIELSTLQTRYEAGAGVAGDLEGSSTTAMFTQPFGMSLAGGILYIADAGADKVWTMNTNMDNLIGRLAGMYAYDGNGNTAPSATFNAPADVSINTVTGYIYIADTGNSVIREISPLGVISTIAGSGVTGYAEGTGAAAQFNLPSSIVVDPARNILYVSDTRNHRIRAIDIPTGQTSLVAGSGTPGYVNGTGTAAAFNNPQQIDIDSVNNILYVADRDNDMIRRVDLSTGYASVLAGGDSDNTGGVYREATGTAAIFNAPCGVQFDENKGFPIVLVADSKNKLLRFISTDTTVTYLMSGYLTTSSIEVDGDLANAVYSYPIRLAYDPTVQMLYVFDSPYPFRTSTGCRIKQVQLSIGGQVSTFAGGTPTPGYLEATGTSARFSGAGGLGIDVPNQVLYVADTGNNRVRRVDAALATFTPTITPTAQNTKTVTKTPTETPTWTEVISPTVTPTASDSATITETPTCSPTGTVTQSATETRTITETGTATESGTVTGTGTITPTESPTPTASPSPTQTGTGTETPTITETGTKPPSPSVTPSATATPSVTATDSCTETPTVTRTGTETHTATITETGTAPETETVTATYENTHSPTGTFTITVTCTYTGTLTVTGTETMSPTQSATATVTASATAGMSATVSPTPPAPTPSPTLTPYVFADKTIMLNEFTLYPNPSQGAPQFVLDITGNAVSVEIKVYSVAFRLIKSYTYADVPSGRHNSVPYDFTGFASGMYFMTAECTGTGGDRARAVREMIIIK